MISKYVMTLLLSSVLLISIVVTSMPAADAAKGSGSFNQKTNLKKVCGDQLCGGPTSPHKMTKEQQMAKSKKMPMQGMKEISDHGWKTKSGTITSVQDPGLGHESHQLAIILPPTSNVYKGILTYSASENIQLVALHGPLADGEDRGQKTWSLDENTKFALTFVDPENSMGTWKFSGNAIAVHTKNMEPFTVSYSVAAGQ
jgi:hypothetical protein